MHVIIALISVFIISIIFVIHTIYWIVGWDRATTTTEMDKEGGGNQIDEAAASDTLVGGTESTSDSTITATSTNAGDQDFLGAQSIRILELEESVELPYVVKV